LKEDFLHYIWKHKYLDLKNLKTIEGRAIEIIYIGEHNQNTGPDFLSAQIRIDNQLWAGNIELHVKSSDWYIHGHEKDPNYNNVILHVVWEHDIDIYGENNSIVPSLEVKNNIDLKLLKNYQVLFSKKDKWINCENEIYKIDNFTSENWLERLFIERLEKKSIDLQNLLLASKNDWEFVLMQSLAKSFGLKVNAEAFLNLINSIEFSVIKKERNNLKSLEALFFGHAGLLESSIEEAYYIELQNEFRYLKKKHKLKETTVLPFQFFRLRPNNFPTIRIAQFASLLYKTKNLFSKVMDIKSKNEFYPLFNLTISEFWSNHYSFTASSKKSQKKLSKNFVDLMLINTIIPLRYTYFKYLNEQQQYQTFDIMKRIKSEKNAVVEKFNSLKFNSKNALESQAILQLKSEYCNNQKCLQCEIGNAILKEKLHA
jgi:hypothetical protein